MAIAFFLNRESAIAVYFNSKWRSLFIYIGKRAIAFFLIGKGDRFFLAEGREAIAFFLIGKGDRFFLAEGREAIAFFWLKGEGRSLFFVEGEIDSLPIKYTNTVIRCSCRIIFFE